MWTDHSGFLREGGGGDLRSKFGPSPDPNFFDIFPKLTEEFPILNFGGKNCMIDLKLFFFYNEIIVYYFFSPIDKTNILSNSLFQ